MRTPRFEIFEGKNNEFFFRLKAKNGRIIFNSKGEGYTQKHNAFSGIESVIANCVLDKQWETFKTLSVVGNKPVWRWCNRLFAGNLEIIGGNETFKTKRAAENNYKVVRRCAPIAEIVDLTKD